MEPRFVVDLNVGRLAKWLRVLGYDASQAGEMTDNTLIRLALREQRVIVTRDRSFVARRLVTQGLLRVALVTSERIWDQLREVVMQQNLGQERLFTRCVECNVVLQEVAREEVRQRVPPYVYQTQELFRECPACHRLYWRGTHWANMRRELARLEQRAP